MPEPRFKHDHPNDVFVGQLDVYDVWVTAKNDPGSLRWIHLRFSDRPGARENDKLYLARKDPIGPIWTRAVQMVDELESDPSISPNSR